MPIAIKNNTQGFMINEVQSDRVDSGTIKSQGKKQNQSIGKSIFAGNLNFAEDSIAKKRKEAQEKALKIVRDAWKSDQAIEDSVQKRENLYDKMKQLKEEAQLAIKDIEANKEALKEEYGIENDSEEQKDLELLEKYQNRQAGVSTESFTEEERERLAEIVKNPLTEYQKYALELNRQEIKFKGDKKDAEVQMQDALSDIRSIKQEDLKSDPMVAAQKQAEKIVKEASKEIIGMLKDEVKENIDEEIEEEKKKAKEAAKEKEKEEERLEEVQEKRAIQEALITGTKEAVEKAEAAKRQNDRVDIPLEETIELAQSGGQSGDVQKLLNEIKSSMNMLEADLKGIKVDEVV